MGRLLQQPHDLQSMARSKLVAWMVAQRDDMLTHALMELLRKQHKPTYIRMALASHIKNIRNYLQKLKKRQNNNNTCDDDPTYNVIIEKTVRRIINTLTDASKYTLIQDKLIGIGFNVIEQMMENLFAKHLTKLELTESTFQWCRSILCFTPGTFPNLVHLTLRMTAGSQHEGSLEADIIKMLHNLTPLKYLAFINYCSDAILCQVAATCPSVEELVILNHEAITDQSMAIISRLSQLTTVKINEGYVTERGIEKLLLKCENLKRIGKFDKIGRCLKHIASIDHSGRTFNLEHYSSKGDTLEQLRLVVQLCPKIANLYVKRAESASGVECRVRNNLPAIIGLTNLSKLCLQNYSFYEDSVAETLQAVGRGLRDLDLQNITDIDRNAMFHISITCPDLQRLSINYCGLKKHTLTGLNKLKGFNSLKEINLDITCYGQRLDAPSKELAHDITYILLSTCLNVESVSVGRGVWIAERTFLRVLDNNPMIYLKSLKILDPDAAGAMTTPVLDRITKHCGNRPEVIISDNMNL